MSPFLIVFVIYTLIPLFIFIRLWRNHSPNLGTWLLESIFYGVLICNLYLLGVWPIVWGQYVRYVVVALFFLMVLKSFRNVPRRLTFAKPSIKQAVLSLIGLSICSPHLWGVILALNGASCAAPSVDLEFPLKQGKFFILHGGSNEAINHHVVVSAQKYALDILELNSYGLRANKLIPQELKDFQIYGASVYSPCDGVVTEAQHLYPDLELSSTDLEHPAGNYLAIAKKDSNVVVILAHLMKDSLSVRQGDSVQKGQEIAKVGNSGNTSEPHLHIHTVVSSTDDLLFMGEGVPMTFEGRFLVRNDVTP